MKPKLNLPSVLAALVAVVTVCGVCFAAQSRKSPQALPTTVSQSDVKHVPLNIKTGLWEITSTLKTSGDMPIPAGMLDKLTPEQRARFEERMKANADAHAHSSSSKACVTQENLNKMDYGLGRPGCTYTIQTSTSTEAKGKYSCEEEGGTVTGTIDVHAPDREHMKGFTHGALNGGGHTMTVDSTFSSKWIGESCGDMK